MKNKDVITSERSKKILKLHRLESSIRLRKFIEDDKYLKIRLVCNSIMKYSEVQKLDVFK